MDWNNYSGWFINNTIEHILELEQPSTTVTRAKEREVNYRQKTKDDIDDVYDYVYDVYVYDNEDDEDDGSDTDIAGRCQRHLRQFERLRWIKLHP